MGHPSPAASTAPHITCLSCGAAAFAKVVHADEFIEKMNSTVLAPQLMAVDLIPGTVENGVLQSKNLEEANAHLLKHLKEDADKDTVIEAFRIASEEAGYERMNGYAAGVLRELQQGVYWRVHIYMLFLCTYILISLCSCVYTDKCKQELVKYVVSTLTIMLL